MGVAVGGLVGCAVAVTGAEVLVAESGVKDGIEVADEDQAAERVVAEAVPQVEFVGLLSGVEDSVPNPAAVVVGTAVPDERVSEGSIEINGDGVTVTGSGSKGVFETVGEGTESATSSITGSGPTGG